MYKAGITIVDWLVKCYNKIVKNLAILYKLERERET